MKFPFVIFPAAPQDAFPGRDKVAYPLVGVVLKKSGKEVRSFALVDSGADDCLFPASLARGLGITIPNQRSYLFSGTAGNPQVAYFEPIGIEILNLQNRAVFSFELDAGFCETLEHTGCGLLGRNGFFSRFKISFTHADNYFEIE